MEQDVRQRLDEETQRMLAEAFALNLDLAEHPEISGEEVESCKKICTLLRRHGIEVQENLGGLPTAFRAVLRQDPSSKKRVLILAEYDALPAIGHACGHCASGSISVLAALALHNIADQLEGTIELIGTPDEEFKGQKIDLIKAGVFEDCSFAMMIHMDTNKSVVDARLLALDAFYYHFHGQPSHFSAAPWDGKNALNGAMLMMHGIDMLRAHVRPETRMHGFIVKGGEAANIVPAYAKVEIGLRHPERSYLNKVVSMVHDCAKGAAMATQTRVEIDQFSDSLDSLLRVETALQVVKDCYAAAGVPFVEQDLTNVGCSDMGNVSQVCPAVHPTLATSEKDIPLHTVEFADLMKEKHMEDVILQGARIICYTMTTLLQNPQLLDKMKEEFEAQRSMSAT